MTASPQLQRVRTTPSPAGCAHEFVKCILCGDDRTDVRIQDVGFGSIVRCRNDGLLYMNPRPRQGMVQRFHTQFVREDNLRLFDAFRRQILRREASAIQAFKSGGQLLDVGCATGTFFEFFVGQQWGLYGVDTSPLGVQAARENYGAEVACGTLQEAHCPDKFFDVVTVLDTLYYSPNPKADLLEMHRVLKDDGVLAVEIPGLRYTLWRDRGPICWLLDGKWMRSFGHSMHLYYFSPSTLGLLLDKAGFRVLQMTPEQASLGRGGAIKLLNDTHFLLAKLVFYLTAKRHSIAGKELYIACKKPTELEFASAHDAAREKGRSA